ncbi:hypothetical protein GETHLI_25330 [Geothrix limicola]|uniref:Protein BatD n=1 Tax=Geothrix limicola TaxID=2927978 RepID=A0ABQ5QHY8_9BACT|nr:hypothetical protein [Geothrix limicola]GLH74031.1 hypothetical protein GETHLI_25330 [Geothrix limicola]
MKGLASIRPLALILASAGAFAAPTWKAPAQLKLGELQVLELREEDPSKPAPPRPTVEDRLGPLRLRAMELLPDGRGWRFQVQALEPGLAVVPPLDLGNEQRSPELRIEVPRDIPYGGPWMGFGGGNDDRLPALPFPWTWASLLLLPPLALIAALIRQWRKGSTKRRLRHATHAFRHRWPPTNRERGTLDAAHDLGRDLLAARFGDAARAWGPADFQARHLVPWDQWAKSLDAARFGHTEPPFPAPEPLVAALEAKGKQGGAR